MLIISGNPGDRRLLSSWFFCAIASLILTLITRLIISGQISIWHLSELFIPPFLLLRHAVLAGIFLIYLRRAHGNTPKKAPRSKFPALLVVALARLPLFSLSGA